MHVAEFEGADFIVSSWHVLDDCITRSILTAEGGVSSSVVSDFSVVSLDLESDRRDLLVGVTLGVHEHSVRVSRESNNNVLGNWVVEVMSMELLSSVPLLVDALFVPVLVKRDIDGTEECMEVVVVHPEFSIVGGNPVKGSLGSTCQFWGSITPWSTVLLRSPWVSDLNEMDSIIGGSSSDSVGMTSVEVLVVLTVDTSSHDVISFIVLMDDVPEVICSVLAECVLHSWHSSQDIQRLGSGSSIHV